MRINVEILFDLVVGTAVLGRTGNMFPMPGEKTYAVDEITD